MCACACVCVCVCVFVGVRTCLYAYMCVSVCVHIHVCMLYAYMCVLRSLWLCESGCYVPHVLFSNQSVCVFVCVCVLARVCPVMSAPNFELSLIGCTYA